MRNLILYPLLAIVGLAAHEPDFTPLPGSQWLPRKSVQWPRPTSGYVPRTTTSRLCLADNLVPTYNGVTSDDARAVLTIAFDELQAEISRSGGRQVHCTKATATSAENVNALIETINIQITGNAATAADLNKNTDESYKLEVTSSAVNISAATVYGARHGLTTLLNMLEVRNFSPPATNEYGHTIAAGTNWHFILPYGTFTIEDTPRLSHRGVMIDTARHYQEWDDLYKVVEGLSRAKMNVLHWHATDDQSFPLVLEKSKEMIHGPACVKGDESGICHGAYNPHMTYHQDDVVDFIKYARQRGVRVYIEIDQPSHARSWANLHTELRACSGLEHQEEGYCVQPICGPLDLANNYQAVRSLADSILEDWVALTGPDAIMHIGMDEIGSSCWGPELRDELSAQWLADSVEKINELTNNQADILVWQDGLVFPTGVEVPEIANKVMTQVWDRASDATKYLEQGRDIIWSNYVGMYLDCGRGNTAIPTFASWCAPYKSWWDVYKQTPDVTVDYDRDMQGVGKIRGGEVALWAEQTDTANIHTLLWPRLSSWGGASWEARTEAPTDPQSVAEGVPVLESQHQLASFSNMMAYAKGIRHTPMFVQWCIYEDEKMCDHFTNSYYTVEEPQTTAPGSSGAPSKIAQVALGMIALAALF